MHVWKFRINFTVQYNHCASCQQCCLLAIHYSFIKLALFYFKNIHCLLFCCINQNLHQSLVLTIKNKRQKDLNYWSPEYQTLYTDSPPYLWVMKFIILIYLSLVNGNHNYMHVGFLLKIQHFNNMTVFPDM